MPRQGRCGNAGSESPTVRTNIHIDNTRLEEAMRATGQTTKRATVEEALRRVVTTDRRTQAIADIAGTGWDGDLEAMRTGRPG
jgi:Arc/MetJ family transcription regulator